MVDETPNFDRPVVVVSNKGVLEPVSYNYREFQQYLLNQGPEGWHTVRFAFNPDQVLGPSQQIEEQMKFVEAALPPEEVDVDILKFLDATQRYFDQVAVQEAYLANDDHLDYRVMLVPEEIFDSGLGTGSRRPSYFRSASNTIFMPYPKVLTRLYKMDLQNSIFHELRHRVARHFLDFRIKTDEGGVTGYALRERVGMESMSKLRDTEQAALEEIFVVGYQVEHMMEIEEPSFQELWQWKRELMAERGINPVHLTTWRVGDQGETGYSEYKTFADSYYILRRLMPDFLDDCIRVRRGEPGARRLLSQKIVQAVGKKGLAGVVYATTQHREDLAWLLYSLALDRQGETVDEKLTNEEIIETRLRRIVASYDPSGKLAERFLADD